MARRVGAGRRGPRPRATCASCGWTGPVRRDRGVPNGRLWGHARPGEDVLCLRPFYDRSTLTYPAREDTP